MDAIIVSMDLPEQLIDAIASALQHRYSSSMPQDVRVLDLAIDDSFINNGFAGSDIKHLSVTILDRAIRTSISLFVKRWNPSPWIIELTRLAHSLEVLLYENGIFDQINSIAGMRVPVIGSVRAENGEWIIMEDVSAELSTWKNATLDQTGFFWRPSPDCLGIYTDLLDRLAQQHVKWEDPKRLKDLRTVKRHLLSQERRLRELENLFREWFGSVDSNHLDSPALREANAARVAGSDQWASKANFTAHRRGNYIAFLRRLPTKDRSIWMRHMQCRDALVEAASVLPQTLLHGDLNWRNIGLCRSGSENSFILIDWEDATLGSHAFDVISLISGPVFSIHELSSLEDHYFERYTFHGGRLLDRQKWKRACEVAFAYVGICRLPHGSEVVRRKNLDTDAAKIQKIIERTNRILHDLTP